MTSSLPRTIAGGYSLLEEIGAGGMGVVYRGIHDVLQRPVAVKMLLPPRKPSADEIDTGDPVERFLREARMLASVQSEHVVNVLHFGRTAEEELFLVMEFVAGDSLSSRLKRDHHVEVAGAVHIARQLSRALAAAHVQGIVHRDLKPANIMLTTRGIDGLFVKVLDFGIARLVNDDNPRLTSAGVVLGTLDYMAPEQISGGDVTTATDIYALGCVLYRMLVGYPPFLATDAMNLLFRHLHHTPEPFANFLPNVRFPKGLEALTLACLDKDASRRPSAAELEAMLSNLRVPAPSSMEGDTERLALVPTPGPMAMAPRTATTSSFAGSVFPARSPVPQRRSRAPALAFAAVLIGLLVFTAIKTSVPSTSTPGVTPTPPPAPAPAIAAPTTAPPGVESPRVVAAPKPTLPVAVPSTPKARVPRARPKPPPAEDAMPGFKRVNPR